MKPLGHVLFTAESREQHKEDQISAGVGDGRGDE